MNTFTYTPDPDNPHDHVSVTVTTSEEELDKVIEAFEGYLRASGFSLHDKHLEVVENE